MAVEKSVELLVDFAASVLYIVMSRKVSHDRAFQEVLRQPVGRKAAREVPPKILYKVSRAVVSDYYFLRFAEKAIYGARGSARRMARLWLLLRADEELLAPLWHGVERFRRKMLKTMPKRVESAEELYDLAGDEVEKLALKHSFPYWFVERMTKLMRLDEVDRLLAFLNEEKWWIRVNTLKADVDKVVRRLEEEGVVVRVDKDLPYMLEVIDYAKPLHHLEEMWRGEIVFQDKASAMVVEALEPEPGDLIVDLTAAPGIKASLIMQLTENRAKLILLDVSWERLKRAKKLLKLYGVDLSRVELVHADSTSAPLLLEAPKALVDAPCSSSGTIGKDPAVKVHLEDPAWAQSFPPLQRALLSSAKALSEVVVYATCSLLPEEGEEVILRSKLELEEPPIPGSPGYAVYGDFATKVRRFFPHIHGTQGFFVARARSRAQRGGPAHLQSEESSPSA